MIQVAAKNYIRVPKEEYTRLKQLQKHFERFWRYFEHLQDIKQSREDVVAGRTIPQEKLFRKLMV